MRSKCLFSWKKKMRGLFFCCCVCWWEAHTTALIGIRPAWALARNMPQSNCRRAVLDRIFEIAKYIGTNCKIDFPNWKMYLCKMPQSHCYRPVFNMKPNIGSACIFFLPFSSFNIWAALSFWLYWVWASIFFEALVFICNVIYKSILANSLYVI